MRLMSNSLINEDWVEALYREEFPKLVAFAYGRIQNEDQAQELVQETFKLLWENVEVLQLHPNIKGWLCAALKNKILNYWKTGRANLQRFVSYDEITLQVPGGVSPEEITTSVTEEEILQKAQRRLSAENYLHLIRLTVDKASHATVAKEFGISIEASQKRLERSRKALQKDFPERRRNMKNFKKTCQESPLTEIH